MILFLFEESKHMEKIKEWVMLENAVILIMGATEF